MAIEDTHGSGSREIPEVPQRGISGIWALSMRARSITRMLKPILTPRDIAERYNRFMPDEVRQFLKDRGIAATVIDRELLGFEGKRIVIPVFGETTRDVLGFRYATMPKDPWDEPNVTSDGDA